MHFQMCLPKPLKTQGLCIPPPPLWVARGQDFRWGTACLRHSGTSESEPGTPSVPGSAPLQEALGIPCHVHSPAAWWSWCHSLLLGEIQAGFWLATHQNHTHWASNYSPLPSLGCFCNHGTPCLSCKGVKQWKQKDIPTLVCGCRYINPGWFHERAIGHFIPPTAHPWGLYDGHKKWPVT